MLPLLLSANLCSLRQQVDRYAVGVQWEIDAKTLRIDASKTWSGRCIIRSAYSLTYAQAQYLSERKSPGIDAKHHVYEGAAGGPVKKVN